MGAFSWLDDAAHPTPWVVVIHPVLIFLLMRVVLAKTYLVYENLPSALDEFAKTKENECSTQSRTRGGDDTISTTSEADVRGGIKPPGRNTRVTDARIEAFKVRKARVAAERAGPLKSKRVKQQNLSFLLNNLEILKCIPVYILQILLTHRVGVLAMRKINQANRFADIFIGFLAMSPTTFMILGSGFTLSYTSRTVLRGYRIGGAIDLETPSVVGKYIFWSFCSLAVPWCRLLFALCRYLWEW